MTPKPFVEDLQDRKIKPHVTINGSLSKHGSLSKRGKVRKTAVPPDVAASEGDAISLRCRKRIEAIFGWTKTAGGLAQRKVRGLAKMRAVFTLGLVAYNLVRLPKLLRPEGDVRLAGGF